MNGLVTEGSYILGEILFEHRNVALCGSMMFIESIKEVSESLNQMVISNYFPEEQENELDRQEMGEEFFPIYAQA